MTCSPDHSTMELGGKSLLSSKTFWLNVLGLAGMIATAFGLIGESDWVQYQAAMLAMLNIILRLFTGEPITGVVTSNSE